MSETNCVSQERLSLKPCCKSYISPFESRCLTKFLGYDVFHNLHKIRVREIGL